MATGRLMEIFQLGKYTYFRYEILRKNLNQITTYSQPSNLRYVGPGNVTTGFCSGGLTFQHCNYHSMMICE
jgi:hypothetical protein